MDQCRDFLDDMEDSQYVEKLRTVFDLCDANKEGYITVEHFKNLVKDHFGAAGGEDNFVGLIHILDPDGRGKISFGDFCEGVQQIQETLSAANQNQQSPKIDCSTESVDTLIAIETADSPNSNTNESSYNEYDLPTDEEDRLGNFYGIGESFMSNKSSFNELDHYQTSQHLSEDDKDSAISNRSSEINENSRYEVTDEDNYEDFGEAELESEGDGPVTFRSTPDRARLAVNSPNRRVSSAASARHLQRASPARRGSFDSDDVIEHIDGDLYNLNDKVHSLEEILNDLTQNQYNTENKHVQMRDENNLLKRRLHTLEEQLRDMEIRTDEVQRDDSRSHLEVLSRQGKEKSDQLDYLTHRLQKVEQENDKLLDERPRLKSEIETLRQENLELQERLCEGQEEKSVIQDDNELLQEKLHHQFEDFEHERQMTGQLLDELGKELGDLRRYKIEVENSHMSDVSTRYKEMEVEIQQLHEENRTLKLTNEDLNAQLLTQCMEEGRNLLGEEEGMSLAAEMETLDRHELMEALKDQKDLNHRMRQYVDKILVNILEKQPSLLEITS